VKRRRPRRRLASAAAIALIVASAAFGAGCGTVGYYARSVSGHLDIVGRARPVGDWLVDPQTAGLRSASG
jgi:predicted aminopeptidase